MRFNVKKCYIMSINSKSGRVWNPQTGTLWPRPGTMTKISILDCKTNKLNMFLTLFILGLYYELLNIHYPTKRKLLNIHYPTKKKFRSDRFKRYETHRPAILRFLEVFSIMLIKQSISLLHRAFKYKNKLYMASWSDNREVSVEFYNFHIFIMFLKIE